MPVFVGPGSAPDGGFEGKSDRVGFPTATSDPTGVGTAVGDMYCRSVGTGSTIRIYNGTKWINLAVAAASFSATGGTTSTSGSDTIHTFTSGPATLDVSGSGNVQLLVVAGGGTGGGGQAGNAGGGGGGGGGLYYDSNYPLTDGQSIPIVIGSGAASVSGQTHGGNGGDTTFGPITMEGGGGGGNEQGGQAGNPGGSGGGCSSANTNRAGATGNGGGTPGSDSPANGWGNDGGVGAPGDGDSRTGGGGGAGGQGSDGNAAPGGPGLQYSISDSPVTYAQGGQGNTGGVPGGTNTGGGGSGGYPGSAPPGSGPGSSGVGGGGIVIVRFAG
jgi:hypothetical protein